jgi:hypothetical protein
MPTKDKHEATTRMYKEWRDARPAVPVPFKYKAKGEGKIEQTWKDIHDKMNRDATSYALAFCTAHLAPSTAQANVLQELSIRDEKLAKKNRELEEKLHHDRIVQDEAAGRSLNIHSLSNKRQWLSDVEKDVLFGSEGGGRGKAAFMKERNKLPLNVRYGLIPRTAAQQYGWGQLNNDHYEELVASCAKRQQVQGPSSSTTLTTSLPDIHNHNNGSNNNNNASTGIRAQRWKIQQEQQIPFVSEFVSADVARQSQIPPEFASLGARPNGSTPFALTVLGLDSKGNKQVDDTVSSHYYSAASNATTTTGNSLALISVDDDRKQSVSHRHARGDFRKRTFAASTRATGVFPTTEFVG